MLTFEQWMILLGLIVTALTSIGLPLSLKIVDIKNPKQKPASAPVIETGLEVRPDYAQHAIDALRDSLADARQRALRAETERDELDRLLDQAAQWIARHSARNPDPADPPPNLTH